MMSVKAKIDYITIEKAIKESVIETQKGGIYKAVMFVVDSDVDIDMVSGWFPTYEVSRVDDKNIKVVW